MVLLGIDGDRLRRLGQVPIGAWSEGVVFGDDSRTVVAQSMGGRALHVLRVEGDALVAAGEPAVFDDGAPGGLGIAGR